MSSIWYFARAILGGAAVVLTAVVLKKIFGTKTDPNPFNQIKVTDLISNAIWAKDDVVEMSDDILPLINNDLESFKQNGATEVYVIKGVALSDFVKQNQKEGLYNDITSDDLNVIQNGIILIAMSESGNVVKAQMIRSQFGISNNLKKQFKNNELIKVKL